MDNKIIPIPYNEKIETNAIGVMTLDDNALRYAIDTLSDEDIYDEINSFNFNMIKKIYEDSGSCNLDILYRRFELTKGKKSYKNEARIATGREYGDVDGINDYCVELKKFTYRRKLHELEPKNLASNLSMDVKEINKKLESILDYSRGIKNGESNLTTYEAIEKGKRERIKMKTGIPVWDNDFYSKGGSELGTTELIFGRPGHGKTFYMILKEAMFAKNNHSGLHFQLEDEAGETGKRIIAVLPGSENRHIANRILVNEDETNLDSIIDTIISTKNKKNIKWISIDHLGRIKVPEHRYDRVAAMTEITNSLTDLCKQENIFGMFSVQPNKSWKGRKAWDNQLREEDLKGASELFEDAFIVTTVFRPNIYPELRVDEGGVPRVLDHKGNKVDYDSVFVTKIKSRRQQIRNEYLHLIQDGNRLSFASDIDYGSNGHSPENNLPEIGTKAPF